MKTTETTELPDFLKGLVKPKPQSEFERQLERLKELNKEMQK